MCAYAQISEQYLQIFRNQKKTLENSHIARTIKENKHFNFTKAEHLDLPLKQTESKSGWVTSKCRKVPDYAVQ